MAQPIARMTVCEQQNLRNELNVHNATGTSFDVHSRRSAPLDGRLHPVAHGDNLIKEVLCERNWLLEWTLRQPAGRTCGGR